MRPFRWLVVALLMVLSVASPGMARVATIATTAPLLDHSDHSIQAALMEAVVTLAKGAVAMGLSWAKVSQVLVLDDMVTVQMVATDTAPEWEEEDEEVPLPGDEPGTSSARPAGLDL
jgi:hypothetical protein